MSIAIEDTKAYADAVTAWKLVPTIATREMLSSGKHYMELALRDGLDRLDRQRVGYEAMLAAAPPPPPAEGTVPDISAPVGAHAMRRWLLRYAEQSSNAAHADMMRQAAHEIERLQDKVANVILTHQQSKARAEAAEAELASIKALPPLHEQIVRMAPEGNRGHE